MAKKRLRRAYAAVKNYLTPLKSSSSSDGFFLGPKLEPYSTQRRFEARHNPSKRYIDDDLVSDDEETKKINGDRLEQAKLSQANDALVQSKESLDLTLRSQHKLLIATLITSIVAIMVALISSTVALFVALHGHSQPSTIYVESNIVVKQK